MGQCWRSSSEQRSSARASLPLRTAATAWVLGRWLPNVEAAVQSALEPSANYLRRLPFLRLLVNSERPPRDVSIPYSLTMNRDCGSPAIAGGLSSS